MQDIILRGAGGGLHVWHAVVPACKRAGRGDESAGWKLISIDHVLTLTRHMQIPRPGIEPGSSA